MRIFSSCIFSWTKCKKVIFHLFIVLTGGGGVDESEMNSSLYKKVTQCCVETISDYPNDIKAIIYAPMGKTAHNIMVTHFILTPGAHSLRFIPIISWVYNVLSCVKRILSCVNPLRYIVQFKQFFVYPIVLIFLCLAWEQLLQKLNDLCCETYNWYFSCYKTV